MNDSVKPSLAAIAADMGARFLVVLQMLQSGKACGALTVLQDTWLNFIISCTVGTTLPRARLELALDGVMDEVRRVLHKKLSDGLAHLEKMKNESN